MYDLLQKGFIRLGRDERGVTLVEYGIAIILALVVGGGIGLTGLGGTINSQLGNAGTCMATGTAAAC